MSYNKDTAVVAFKHFLERAYIEEIPLVSLRPREISEEVSYEGDYDFYISPLSTQSLLKLLYEIAIESKISFRVSRLKHGKIDVKLYNPADNRSITLEIWNVLSITDPAKKVLRYITPTVLDQHVYKDNDRYRLSLDIEVLYYLSHLYTAKKSLDMDLVQIRLEHYYDELISVDSFYAQLFEDLRSRKSTIKEVAAQANLHLATMGIAKFKSNLSASIQQLIIKFDSSIKRLGRQICLTCNMIPVIGPDGVGKTSLIDASIQKSDNPIDFFRFKKTFRVSPLYKIGFIFLSYRLKNQLHLSERPGKTQVDDRYGNFVILNACVFYPLRMIRYALTTKKVFIDRYFHEYLLQNIRWNCDKASLRSDWKRLLKWIPQPHKMIHLDAPNEVILSRKTELDECGLNAYRTYLSEIFLKKPIKDYLYLNTDNSIELSSDLILKFITTKH